MKSRKLTIALFIFYLLVLSWIILLKTGFSFTSLETVRSINLIPFGKMLILNGSPSYNEIIYNGLVFVPFGVFTGMLGKKHTFVKLVVPTMLLSLFFEAIQYIFAIGVSDITDLMANTLGGILGIGIFFIFHKICKEKVYKVLNITALILGFLLVAALAVIRVFFLRNIG